MNKLSGLLCVVLLSGCASMIPAENFPITTEQREFIYDFTVPSKSKQELFKSARNFLAQSYVNSKSISRVEDIDQGTIIAKALTPWYISDGGLMKITTTCYANYDITFIAKDGKARLQLKLVEGANAPCTGWTLPMKKAYPKIVSDFNETAKQLENALNGNSSLDSLNKF